MRYACFLFCHSVLQTIVIIISILAKIQSISNCCGINEVVIMQNKIKSGMIGIVTGLLNGLFGSGGGTVVVPAMERILKVETHKAHATAIAVILPLSVVSAIVYSGSAQVDWLSVLYVSAGGMLGGFIGAKLLKKISAKWLHKVFGVFMIAAALRMMF